MDLSDPERPLVSIVTPCLNAARFIAATVESVLGQDYPRIEHIVMDGGSADGTLALLERYKDRIAVYSERDNGAPDAINKGIRRSCGAIVTFLNADDYYLPGAVSAAVRALQAHPDAAAVYADGIWVDESGEKIGDYPVSSFDRELFRAECFICQPASFLRRGPLEEINLLDAAWRRTFDYDLWIRLSRRYPMRKAEGVWAASRMHRDSISLGSRRQVFEETIRLLRHHFGYAPFRLIHSYCSYLADGRDQFFEPLRPSFWKYAKALPYGLYHNRRHPIRYAAEWASVMSWSGFLRRLRGR